MRPPATYREPMTKSACSAACSSRGTSAGLCERSASIWQMCVASVRSATYMPSMYDRPRPRFPVRCSTCTRARLAAAYASAICPVPSGEASSTMSTRKSGIASSCSTSGARLARSLYVGTMTSGRIRVYFLGPSKRSDAICSETSPTRNTITANRMRITAPLGIFPFVIMFQMP